MNNIRNFSIIAHIDHGKSTLSDRIIQICGGLTVREMKAQILDSMDIERERGITIKAQSVTLNYKSYSSQKVYKLNFIDTPGHVDFTHEVSRSLSACEGVLLLIDASQGIEAQTLSNYRTANQMGLKILPIINKIDLKTANPEKVAEDIKNMININTQDIICCSAKTGVGVNKVLEKLVHNIPAPDGKIHAPLQALIIDSWFNKYFGVVLLVRIKNGVVKKGQRIKIIYQDLVYTVERLGIFTPKKIETVELQCGEVGWISCGIKSITAVPVGHTITSLIHGTTRALPGFKKVKPQVYSTLFPTESKNYEAFRSALGKLSLNDASLFYKPENSKMLGFGFRCGFLGMLHMEIIQARLEREYNLNLVTTAPTVIYEVLDKEKNVYIDTPSNMPFNAKEIREPIVTCYIFTPKKFLGSVMQLCIKHRGLQRSIEYCTAEQVALVYDMPMAEVIFRFFHNLKSISQGYASLDYNFKSFRKSDIVTLKILVNGSPIDALSLMLHRSISQSLAKQIVKKMKIFIPRQQFDINIQASIDNRIFVSDTLKKWRKDVIAKCYGGDVSRKKKLLSKQKEGKKYMKKIGKIDIPKEAFLSIMRSTK